MIWNRFEDKSIFMHFSYFLLIKTPRSLENSGLQKHAYLDTEDEDFGIKIAINHNEKFWYIKDQFTKLNFYIYRRNPK